MLSKFNLRLPHSLLASVIVSAFLFTSPVFGDDLPSTYTMKVNESLSSVCRRMFSGPVWGSRGSYKKVLALNPKILNPNLVFPGDIIILSSSGNKPSLASDEESLSGLTTSNLSSRKNYGSSWKRVGKKLSYFESGSLKRL